MTNDRMAPERWRPIAYTAIADRLQARRIADALHRLGFLVLEHATGLHLVGALADVIEGSRNPLVWPHLIVTDVRSAGCSGATIAGGLRELGVEIPIILIAGDDDPVPALDRTFIVEYEQATGRVPELAKRWAPAHLLLERGATPQRMVC
jgi:hypothetical protein